MNEGNPREIDFDSSLRGFELSGVDCISKPVCIHEFVIQSKLLQLLRESETVVSTSLIVYC